MTGRQKKHNYDKNSPLNNPKKVSTKISPNNSEKTMTLERSKFKKTRTDSSVFDVFIVEEEENSTP